MLYDTNLINEIEYKIYNKWFDYFLIDLPPHEFLYLKTTPEEALDRIYKRNRDGESSIDIDYVKMCHNYHENIFAELTNSSTIEGNLTNEENVKEIIKTFIL
jgi:thymidylate kinase